MGDEGLNMEALNVCTLASKNEGFPCSADAITGVSLSIGAAGLGLLMIGFLMNKVRGN